MRVKGSMYRKFTATICSVILCMTLMLSSIHAAPPAIVARADWKADDKVFKANELYRFPANIKIVPLKLPKEFWVVSSNKLVQNLYYYFATRSSFGDIPFHYVIGFDGKVFQTSRYSDFQQVVFGQDEDTLVIGVMSKNLDDTLGIVSLDTIQTLTADLASQYNIKSENISVAKAVYKFNESNGVDSITLEPSADTFAQDSIRAYADDHFKPVEDTYNLKIEEIKLPENELKEGDTATVEIKVKNDSTRDLFGSKSVKLLLVKSDGENSSLYDQASWASLNSVVLLDNGARLEKGQTGTYSFIVKAPLSFEDYSEEFDLVYAGAKLAKTTVKIKLAKPAGTIIEIKPNDAGYLNVRENPPFGEVVTQVLPGEKFVVLEEITGYYKIKTKDGKEGWVSAAYVKKIQ